MSLEAKKNATLARPRLLNQSRVPRWHRWNQQNQRGWCLGHFFRVGRTHQVAVLATALSPSSTLNNNGARGHKADQVAEEGALSVFSIKAFGLSFGQGEHFSGDYAQARRFKAAVNLTYNIFRNSIGFNNAQVRSTAMD